MASTAGEDGRPPGGALRHALAKGVVRALLLALLPAVVLLAAVVAAGKAGGVYVGDLLRDPSLTQDFPPWTGALSSATVLLWTAGAAVALAAASGGARDHARTRLAAGLGAVTLLLALDDQYLLHEDLLPRAGVPEEATLLVEAVLLGLVLVAHRALLAADPDTGVLALALLLLGASLGIDLVAEQFPAGLQDARLLAEDGTKLCGAAVLLRYLVLLSRGVPPRLTPRRR